MTLQPSPSPDQAGAFSLHGPMAAEVSNVVVRLFREHFGKGPMQARTIIADDTVVSVLRGGFTQAEQTLYRAGRADVVDQGRRAMQDVFQREMRAAVERITGRRVEAFMSANHHEPDASVEIFLLDGPPSRQTAA
jgi:uncharacterized protein YbcI